MPLIVPTLVILIAATSTWLLARLFIMALFRPYIPKQIMGFRLQGMLPAALPVIARYASDWLQKEFLSPGKLSQTLGNPALLQELKPEIENHIDLFLKTKLKEAFPLLSNFMGEKTLDKFKQAFLTEVESILPELLKSHSLKLLDHWQPQQLLHDKIAAINVAELEKILRQNARRQLLYFQLAAAIFGAFFGALQLIVLYLCK